MHYPKTVKRIGSEIIVTGKEMSTDFWKIGNESRNVDGRGRGEEGKPLLRIYAEEHTGKKKPVHLADTGDNSSMLFITQMILGIVLHSEFSLLFNRSNIQGMKYICV